MITLVAAAIAAASPAQAAPANPHAQHSPAQHAQASGQPKGEHQMGGMKDCCCCKDMAGKAASPAAATKPVQPGHSGH